MKFSMKFIAMLFFMLATTIYTKAKDAAAGSISGTVTDKKDGTPIPGATVTIPDLKTGTITDANGKFTLDHISRGTYIIQVSYLGYSSFTQRVDFTKTTEL